jgi:hypothetical protein
MNLHSFDPAIFADPEDFMGLPILFWPKIDDQIEYIRRRQAQVVRTLSFYKGQERDYEDLSRDRAILAAILLSLKAVQQLKSQV